VVNCVLVIIARSDIHLAAFSLRISQSSILSMAAAQIPTGLSSRAISSGSFTERDQTKQATFDVPLRLSERCARLKREIVRLEDDQTVAKSYEKLKDALVAEADLISREQQSAIPKIDILPRSNEGLNTWLHIKQS
jgi:hypothetical protein